MCLLGISVLRAQGAHGRRHDAGNRCLVSGKITSTEQETVDFATVYLKGTSYGGATDGEGRFRIHAPAGKYTLVVSAVGYKTVERPLTLDKDGAHGVDITITPDVQQLEEVTVVSTGVSRVKRSAFNAVAVDTRELQNTTKNLSEALAKAPGMKLRESGGVGSDMQVMMDGFSGKHVKVFIDGIPTQSAQIRITFEADRQRRDLHHTGNDFAAPFVVHGDDYAFLKTRQLNIHSLRGSDALCVADHTRSVHSRS